MPADAGLLYAEAREIEAKLAAPRPVDETALARFIQDVDAHAGYLFARTLEGTGRSFTGHIERLFGGGWGRLAGSEGGRIVVAVRLPDKKECELSLLSDGEESLAGIALVPALASAGGAKSTVSVLILDEVDAPLDEANAVRFARLLGEIARENQVLAVTRNPRTMEAAADRLGVSTSPHGTSTILAVRLDKIRSQKLPAVEVG